MAGLALLAREAGLSVTGSDHNVYPPMSTQLAGAGIEVFEGFAAEHLRPAPDLVVVGNALTRGNPAIEYLLNSTIPYTSGPQWLAEQVLRDRWVLAVAGTHGKTTTTAMLSWILQDAGLAPGFVIGGIAGNFGVSARLGETPFFVVEADEYDSAFFDKRSKFLHYRPRTLILNNLEFDHADIFPDLDAIKRQFHHLVRTLPNQGLIVSNGSDAALADVLAKECWTPVEYFSVGDNQSYWQARAISNGGSRFDVYREGRLQGEVSWSQLGRHNVANALAAIAAARHAGVAPPHSLAALAGFQGVKRRMELRGVVNHIRVYDDFAHHPTAIATTLQGLRERVGSDQRIIAVLELRSNTMRSGIFNEQLVESLQQADLSLICYHKKHQSEVLSDVLSEQLTSASSRVCPSADAVLDALLNLVQPGDHVVIMSNGGFADIHQRLLSALGANPPA
jgi:UDP-N-acetylmuramate: L-alanyl-gamma-D-glutamyl-meso-diaminopimelate ligase